MTRPKPDDMSWGSDGETAVEVPTNESQQRLKASAKPELKWEEDAHTAVAPVDAIIPAEAYRDAQPQNEARAPASAPEAIAPTLEHDAEPEAVFELSPRPEIALPLPARAAPRWPVPPPLPKGYDEVRRDPPPQPKKRAARRWLVLALLMVVFYAGSYFVVSVIQKLEHHAATAQPGAPSLSVWDACGEVLEDTGAKLKNLSSDSDRR